MAGFGAFLTHLFFTLPQEKEKNLKIFNISTIFDFISNYTNYLLHANYSTQDIFLRLISLLGDLKCS